VRRPKLRCAVTAAAAVGGSPCYQLELELRGSVSDTISALASMLQEQSFTAGPELQAIQAEWKALQNPPDPESHGSSVYPLNTVARAAQSGR